MSENLMETVAPHLSPPVTRESSGTQSDSGEGADVSMLFAMPMMFAGDEDE
jgi:hypothetical protein